MERKQPTYKQILLKLSSHTSMVFGLPAYGCNQTLGIVETTETDALLFRIMLDLAK
jgi:hypothetical protein